MKFIIGIFLALFINYASANEVVEVSMYESYFLKVEPNATVIFDPKSPLKVRQVDSSTYELTVSQSVAKISVMIIDSKGVRNVLVKGASLDGKTTRKTQEKRLVRGYIKYSDKVNYNITDKKDSRYSNAIWYNQLWFSEPYSLISSFDYRNAYDRNGWILNDYYLRFTKDYRTGNQYYLHYGSFSELIDRPYGFLSSSYRGFIFGYNALSWVDLTLWTGKNKDFTNLPDSSGFNIDFKNLKLGYAENKLRKVYNANTNFNLGDYLSTNTSVTSDGNSYLVSNQELFTVPKDYQFLGLQYLMYSLGYVPEYSFGLSDTVYGKREDHKIQAQFANQDVPKNIEQSELELVPGVLSSMLTYNYSKFDLYQRDYYSLNTIYNTTYVFSGLWSSYEKSFLLNEPSESLYFRPYLEIFFSGEANKGLSIRNSHNFSYKKSGLLNVQDYNSQSSTLGVYYSQLGYRYGVFAGSGQDNLSSLTNSAESSSVLYGADLNYRKKKFNYNLNYVHTLVKDSVNYSDTLRASVNYSNKNHQFGVTASYKSNHSVTVNEEVYGSLAYTWNYDIGNETLSEKISNLRTSIAGRVCFDKNLNLKCDDDETIDSNISVSLSKDPEVETSSLSSNGDFSFSNLSPRTYFITLNNLPKNIDTFSSLAVDVGAGAGKYTIDIPLVDVEEIKIRPLIKGVYSPNTPISLLCDNGVVLNKTEILSDYVSISKPKNLKCEENFDFSKFDENIFIKDSFKKGDVTVYNLESSYKQIQGLVLFGEKPVKTTIKMNNKVIETGENGRFLEIVDGKDPIFRFSKPGYECKTSPSYDILYSEIIKYVSLIIRCNPK